MKIPEPVPGLVLRYAYFWNNEASAGHDEASKDRPAAVLLTATTKAGAKVVTVPPVTHAPPSDERLAVKPRYKPRPVLGSTKPGPGSSFYELNHFQWPGPDLRPVSNDLSGEVAFGRLPASLYEKIRQRWLAAYEAGKITQVKRTSQACDPLNRIIMLSHLGSCRRRGIARSRRDLTFGEGPGNRAD